jgi:hypothetical protein
MTSQTKKTITYYTVFFSITGLFFLFYHKPLFSTSIVKTPNLNLVQNQIQPFEMEITNSNYSNAFSTAYILSQNELKIIFQGELEGEKDTVIFRKHLQPSQSLRSLAAIKLDSLKSYYENPCVRDGSQLIVQIKKDNIEKQVQLNNFYHPDIGIAIELINKLVPKKYIIWYDKKSLMQEMLDCK